MPAQLEVTREQVLAFRRRTGSLDERMPPGPRSLRRAAWAGLQDSVPRAALLSIHARVAGAGPSTWEDPSLAQLWGPRYSVYVVAARDVGIFSLGALPDEGRVRQRAESLAARLVPVLASGSVPYGRAGEALGVHPNALRYAAKTGTILIRWDGARQSTIWRVEPPELEPEEARRELARRYLHVCGPATAPSFARWAGIGVRHALATFDELRRSLTPVETPLGDAWVLSRDERALRADAPPPAPARLLPSGDAYFLLQGADRELLVPDAEHRRALWTPRIWPGALLVKGEIAGTWRRADTLLSVHPWRRLSAGEREAVAAEAHALPLPGDAGRVVLAWEG